MTSVPVLSIDDADAPARASDALAAGKLVALPTDTVYGLAADLWNAEAVSALYAAKHRAPDKAIPILLSETARTSDLASEWPHAARLLAAAFWPGPLTLIVPRRPDLPTIVSSLPTIGLRVPAHYGLRAVIEAAGGALAVSSANLSGAPDSLTVEEAVSALGDLLALALDGGRCEGGVASTVADVTADPVRVLRTGPVSEEALQAALA